MLWLINFQRACCARAIRVTLVEPPATRVLHRIFQRFLARGPDGPRKHTGYRYLRQLVLFIAHELLECCNMLKAEVSLATSSLFILFIYVFIFHFPPSPRMHFMLQVTLNRFQLQRREQLQLVLTLTNDSLSNHITLNVFYYLVWLTTYIHHSAFLNLHVKRSLVNMIIHLNDSHSATSHKYIRPFIPPPSLM